MGDDFDEEQIAEVIRRAHDRMMARIDVEALVRKYRRRDDPGGGGASVREPRQPSGPSLGPGTTADE